MKKMKHVVAFVVILAAAAFAARQATYSKVNDVKPQWFTGGIFVGTDSKNPVSDTKNKVAYHLCGVKVFDFPALAAGAANSLVQGCADSSSLTITGCGFNDRLSVGVDQVLVNGNGDIRANVSAANTVVVTACQKSLTDGGTFDMPDASYTVCCDGY